MRSALNWIAHRLRRIWPDLRWWLRWRFDPKYQFHIVRTDLERGEWYDTDERILHACMCLLGEHIAMDGGAEHIEKWTKGLRDHPSPHHPELTDAQADRQSESLTIYRWWMVERPADKKRREDLVMAIYRDKKGDEAMYKEMRTLEAKIDDDENKMLLRLMAIRRGLWT